MRVQSAIVAVVAINVLAACSVATPRPRQLTATALDAGAPYAPGVELDSALRDTIAWYRREWAIPGAAIATFTCESRRLAWDGVTRIDEDTPIGPHSLFRMEMHAAPMIATAALRLERRGVLKLDAPLRELWPSAAQRAPWYAHITLAELLSYTPPIPAFYGGDSASLVPDFPADSVRSAAHRATRWYLRQRPDSIPSRWRGSLPSVVVAAAILEQVTGKPITDVIHAEVFAPLGLRATFLPRGQYGPNQPRGHFASGDTLRYPGHERSTVPRPYLEASDLAISLPDFVTFLQAHLCAAQGRPSALLTQAEALRIYGQTEAEAPTPLGWWSLNTEHDPIRTVQGNGAGFMGTAGFSKLSGRGALMLVNAEGIYTWYAAGWVWAEVLGRDPELPRSRSQIPRRPPAP